MTAASTGNVSSVPPPAMELTTPAANADRHNSARIRVAWSIPSRPPHDHAEVLILLLEQPLVGGAQLLRGDPVGDQPRQAQPPRRQLRQQPLLRLVDVP